MFTRKKARDMLFKLVFELGFSQPEASVTYENFLLEYEGFKEEERLSEEDVENFEFVKTIFVGVLEKHDEVLDLISSIVKGYTIDRMFKVDLAILVLSVYELKYYEQTPTKVLINEAVELAKKYSTDKSYKFINSALANVVKQLKG